MRCGCRSLLAFVLCFLVALPALPLEDVNAAASPGMEMMTFSVSFGEPVVDNRHETCSVAMDGLDSSGAPGEPVLPMRTVRLLLPHGQDLDSVWVGGSFGDDVALDLPLEWNQGSFPLSRPDIAERAPRNEEIYASSEAWPFEIMDVCGIQQMRGYPVLILNLFPVSFFPQDGRIQWFSDMEVTVLLKERTGGYPMLRESQGDKEIIQRTVDNPDVTDGYPLSPSLGLVDYLVITYEGLNNTVAPYDFQDLLDAKSANGTTGMVVTVESIVANPEFWGDTPMFNDTAAQIRN
ncbi:MAG: hypothetical protein KAT70_01975, partial [Thermoplasmata archaeon]|nr:hypothetical protein [Thermoplasmata archaeon]